MGTRSKEKPYFSLIFFNEESLLVLNHKDIFLHKLKFNYRNLKI